MTMGQIIGFLLSVVSVVCVAIGLLLQHGCIGQ